MKKIFLNKLGVLLLGISALTANVFAQNVDPKVMLESRTQEVIAEISNNQEIRDDNEELFKFVEEKIVADMDISYTSKLVLGKYWKRATDQQKADFEKEFRTYLIATYSTGLFAYDDQEIEFGETRYDDKKPRAIVPASIKVGTESNPIPVEFMVVDRKEKGGWKIYNAKVQGLNLVTNFRKTYTDIISKNGLDALIDQLKSKNEQLLSS